MPIIRSSSASALLIVLVAVAACRPTVGPASGSATGAASGSLPVSTLPSPSPTERGGLITGKVTAGPTCPVERPSPDPACAERAVAGAVLVVQDAGGREVARTESGADGGFTLTLVPGWYRLVPQPEEGLLGTPQPIPFQVEAGVLTPPIPVTYDTGIR
jgi:hypothetical protein